MSKILITGATGYLAKTLIPYVANRADVTGTARNVDSIESKVNAVAADLGDYEVVHELVMLEQPDAIIHCAACNPGDGSDADMLAVNEVGSLHIATAASSIDCHLVSVSSDTVFSGNDAPYADDAHTSPQQKNGYAVSKARAEAAIFSKLPHAMVVRTSLIYGTDSIDRGTQGFAQRLADGDRLKLFTDVMRQPVHDKALAASLFLLATDLKQQTGTINVVGDELMSRFDFAVRMFDYWDIDYQGRIDAISGQGIEGLPMNLALYSERAKALGLPTPGVSAVLANA